MWILQNASPISFKMCPLGHIVERCGGFCYMDYIQKTGTKSIDVGNFDKVSKTMVLQVFKLWLKNPGTWHIICLTREPMARVHLAAGKFQCKK